MWGPLRPKYFQKIQNPKYLAKKNIYVNGYGLGRGTLNTCAKIQGLTLRNGVDIGV